MNLYRKSMIFILILLIPAANAQKKACIAPSQAVPFVQVNLNAGCIMNASYSFRDASGTHPMILCYQTNGNATLRWPYKRSIKSSAMPQSLVTSSQYEGELADFSGTLSIQNTSSSFLLISCQYAFLKG